jgi:hypothetical protein
MGQTKCDTCVIVVSTCLVMLVTWGCRSTRPHEGRVAQGTQPAQSSRTTQTNKSPETTQTTQPSGTRPSDMALIREAITHDSWVKTLGAGPFTEQYIYRFFPDGKYESTFRTDHTTPKEVGTWRLDQNETGQAHLKLHGPEKSYWLLEDSILEYDQRIDKILVSGPRYVGRQPLDRQKVSP